MKEGTKEVIGSLDIYGEKNDQGLMQITGFQVEFSPELHFFESIARGIQAFIPGLAEKLAQENAEAEGCCGSSCIGDPDEHPKVFIAHLADDLALFGLKIAKADGSEFDLDKDAPDAWPKLNDDDID